VEGEEPLARYKAHYAEHCLDRTAPFPGVLEGLQRLAGKAALGVVTNKPAEFTRTILLGLRLDGFFEAVVGGDATGIRKPDPRPVLRALERLGYGPWDAWMVGDSPGDVEAGRAAGSGTCAVSWGYRPHDLLRAARPDAWVESFAELVEAAGLGGAARPRIHDVLGRETFFRLARAFYARVDRDPRLRPMFPPRLDEAIERQALFLIQFFGGPSDYARARGAPRLRMRHAGFAITPAAREAWLENMLSAMDETGIPEPAAGVMRRYFAHTASMLVNAPEPGGPR
jgi:HAD superfamily hydrolase (TIGR01509 family)